MNEHFPQYTTDYISGVMSLRKPQSESLRILDDILSDVDLDKNMDLQVLQNIVNQKYRTCTDFERSFMSLTFALATGVGKTRLMGAFITYLYTQKGIRNFFVVAPNTTIYDKLRRDLSDMSSPKYVFRGIGCFGVSPEILTDTDYKSKQITTFNSDIRIFVYNIDKFNQDDAKMKQLNEMIGESFFQYLSSLPDLVLIMDESHHYRAPQGSAALNELNPLMGIELTATPLVTEGSKQIPFKNVVYEYPLSKAIEDGYTRTPYAVTRTDIDFYNFGDEQLDKMMLQDGITCHENTKRKLQSYADNHKVRVVKPFMLVVCKDTAHAEWVENYVKSDEFRDGYYRHRTLVVHSKKKGSESEENTRILLGVEDTYNPIEIVIHVNMLKEGWDVNNLYTIVPLRTAASKILREQMVGRGLRLPYGERTGDRDVDAVMLTAHDKFKEIIEEAQRGDSIFKAGNVIKVEELPKEETIKTQIALDFDAEEQRERDYEFTKLQRDEKNDDFFSKVNKVIEDEVKQSFQKTQADDVSKDERSETESIVNKVVQEIEKDADIGDTYHSNRDPFFAWIKNRTEEVKIVAQNKFIPIPKIKITDEGVQEYEFVDFDLDLSSFNHAPISNDLLIQNLGNLQDSLVIEGGVIVFDGYNPKKVILEEVCKQPEIDYEKCSDLLYKLITAICNYYEEKYGPSGLKNIVMMYRRDIGKKIYSQMMTHFYCTNGFLREEVIGTRDHNLQPTYNYSSMVGLYEEFTGDIRSVLFTGIKKGVFSSAMFHSKEGELTFARVVERDPDVVNWLRPHPMEFDITYNNGKRYEPDFVVETSSLIYLVEIKGEDKLNDPDVIAKKKRAIQYCDVVSRWSEANGRKKWQYLFIPSKQVLVNSSFSNLADRFKEL